jgi:hypothetical protein
MSGSDEDRFLDDISFGVECLLYRNVPVDNILIFVDQPSGSNFLSAYNFPKGIEARPTAKLYDIVTAKKVGNLIIVVTGHGEHLGISALPLIKPSDLLVTIKNMSDIRSSLIVLGQCFAGIFNYLEARSRDPETGVVQVPEVCLVGATELTFSVSSYIDLSTAPDSFNSFTACNKQWQANLFLVIGQCKKDDLLRIGFPIKSHSNYEGAISGRGGDNPPFAKRLNNSWAAFFPCNRTVSRKLNIMATSWPPQ